MLARAPARLRWVLPNRYRDRRVCILLLLTAFSFWIWCWHGPQGSPKDPPVREGDEEEYPLITHLIEEGRGDGGRWYIPPNWFEMNTRFLQELPHNDDFSKYMDIRNPRSPAEAAHFALELCLRKAKFLRDSKIPLIIHQTWKNTNPSTWNHLAQKGAEQWLRAATGESHPDLPQMAYILWDDNAVQELINVYEKDLIPVFKELPYTVEKADIFRVVVLKWFGGIYADIDTTPVKHPTKWITEGDLTQWADTSTQQVFDLHQPLKSSYNAPPTSPYRPRMLPDSQSDLTPVSYYKTMSYYRPQSVDVAAIVGIEADTKASANDYWRSGYLYPVQLTNWAMAMAPHHPIAVDYIKNVIEDVALNRTKLRKVDPVALTGPGAFTRAVKEHAESENENFKWNSLSGIGDAPGGRGKITAGDVLVLPITGFSPGRGKFHNMGSKPVTHRNARLSHVAQGSWRHTSVRVEAGKLCRTFLGGCREWSKVP